MEAQTTPLSIDTDIRLIHLVDHYSGKTPKEIQNVSVYDTEVPNPNDRYIIGRYEAEYTIDHPFADDLKRTHVLDMDSTLVEIVAHAAEDVRQQFKEFKTFGVISFEELVITNIVIDNTERKVTITIDY